MFKERKLIGHFGPRFKAVYTGDLAFNTHEGIPVHFGDHYYYIAGSKKGLKIYEVTVITKQDIGKGRAQFLDRSDAEVCLKARGHVL